MKKFGQMKKVSKKHKIEEALRKLNVGDRLHRESLIEEVYEDSDYFSRRSFDAIKCQIFKNTNIKFKLEDGFLIRIS